MNVFPKNIFQVWFQGCDNIEKKEFIENRDNWKLLNPDWNYMCVSDIEMSEACKNFSEECYQIYNSLPIMHMKIDLARYILVYLYGGIYIDMDAYVLRSLDYNDTIKKIIHLYENEEKHVLGLSVSNINGFEKFLCGIELNNAFMISTPRNPKLKRLIDYMLNRCEKYKQSLNAVQLTTGPVSFNNFFRNDNYDDSVFIQFEPEIFEPCDLNHVCNITKNTIAIHQFELSWLSGFEKRIGKLYFYLRLKWIFLLIIIVLIFISYRYKKMCSPA